MFTRWFRSRATGEPHMPAGAVPPGSTPFHVRQGDVLLVAVPDLPTGARQRRRRGRLVLATGETTGHAHAIAEPDTEEFVAGGERYVLVRSRAQLIHEEHDPIAVPAGTYRVVIQREFAPERASTGPQPGGDSWRTVGD